MKNKIMKVLGVVMTVAMLASFMVAGAPVSAAGNPASINEWEGVTLPTMVPVSDVDLIEQANDGTIFISVYFGTATIFDGVSMGAGTWAMLKSMDGYAWEATNVNNEATRITAIEPSDNYSNDQTVYVAIDDFLAGHTTLYRCTGGAEVTLPKGEMGQISPGVGTSFNATLIYDLDSYYDGSDVWLLAATNVDVFAIKDDRGLTTTWTDMQLSETLGGGYADAATPQVGVVCYKAEFAPDYSSSGVIWAVYSDALASPALAARFPLLTGLAGGSSGYGIIARHSGSTLWGTVITPEIISATAGTAIPECDIEFAASYNSDTSPELYAALSFGAIYPGAPDVPEDDIYRIECNKYGTTGNVTGLDVDPADRVNFCSLEIVGDVMIAGAYETNAAAATATEVWYSTNAGTSWQIASRNPTGELDSTNRILISEYGPTEGMAFAATGGGQSAVSISGDNGDTWSQIALIDDDILTIDDLAFMPGDTAAIMISTNAATVSSYWTTDDVTARVPGWQRDLCIGYSTTISAFDKVAFSDDGIAVMLYDDTADRIYRATDDANFANWRNTATWGTINDWIVPNANTVYAATTNGFYSTALVGNRLAGSNLQSVAYIGDAVAVGDNASNVYASVNKGNSWGAPILADGLGSSTVYVAFDANYASNHLLYYATSVDKVGKILLDGDEVSTAAGSNVVLTDGNAVDGTRDACPGTAFTDIIVAADNTMYVLGTSSGAAGGGAISLAGTATLTSASTATAVLDLASDYVNVSDLTVTSGTFNAGELLNVKAANVVADSSTVVSGRIYVEGQTSSALGYFDFTVYDDTIWSALLIDGEDVSVVTIDLAIGAAAAAPTSTSMFRLLLGQADNNWENPTTTALANMSGLWVSEGSNLVWTIVAPAATPNTLAVFEDFLTGKTQGVSAVEFQPSPSKMFKQVEVSWTHMNEDTSNNAEDGTEYLISVTYDGTTGPVTFYDVYVAPGDVLAGEVQSKIISGLSPLTKYTIKVRVNDDAPIQSRWSSEVSVTTGAYLYAPVPIAPVQAQPQTATTSLNPTFTWTGVPSASSYDIEISDSATFTNIIASANLTVTGYTYEGDALDYDTDYYWRVRSVYGADKSVWSSYSVWDSYWAEYMPTGAPATFHTMMDPEVMDGDVTLTVTQTQTELTITQTNPTYTIPVPEFTVTAPAPPASTVTTITNVVDIPEQKTPAYIWAIVAIGALLTIAVIVLIIRTRRVV